jgi:hypothetical protein
MRVVIGVLGGIVVAVLCIYVIEAVGHSVFPAPPGIDPYNPADVERLMAALPAGAFAFVLAGWFIGTLLGASVANRIARRSFAGWIVALVVVVGGVATMMMIPHPLWMWAAGLALPALAAWLAQRMTPAGPAPPMS